MEKIILELPFAHELELIPPRMRTPQTFYVRSSTPVAIASVTGEEAPLAVEVVFTGNYAKLDEANKARYHPDGPSRIVFRGYQGKLYEQVGKAPVDPVTFAREANIESGWQHGKKWDRPFTTYDYPASPAIPVHLHGNQSVLGLKTPREAYSSLAPGNVRLHKDKHDERETEAKSILESDLIAIDGSMWFHRRSWNPRLLVVTSNGKVSIDVTMGGQAVYYVSEFRLDDLDTARKFAAMEAEAEGLKGFEDLEDVVTIHDSSLVTGDNAVMLARQATDIVNMVFRSKMMLRSNPLIAMADAPGEHLAQAAKTFKGMPAGFEDACLRMDSLQEFLGALAERGWLAAGEFSKETRRLETLSRRWTEIERPRLDLQPAVNEDDAFAFGSLSP